MGPRYRYRYGLMIPICEAGIFNKIHTLNLIPQVSYPHICHKACACYWGMGISMGMIYSCGSLILTSSVVSGSNDSMVMVVVAEGWYSGGGAGAVVYFR
jgi:hypothetical protein